MNREEPQYLTLDRRWSGRLLPVAVVAAASAVTYAPVGFGAWQQFAVLLHVASGVLMAGLLVPYTGAHVMRTIGLKRPAMSIIGFLLLFLCAALALTGLYMTVFGQRQAERWVYHLHVWAAWTVLGGVVLHVVSHRLFLPARRLRVEGGGFPSVQPATGRRCAISLGIGAATVGLSALVYASLPGTYVDAARVTPYALPYGENPFRPSQTETADGGFIDPRRVARSDRCGASGCHAEVLAEWRASMHSQAASDPAYQTNIRLLAGAAGMPSTRYCEGCHAPVALVAGFLSHGGALGTRWHMREGVSCLGCHAVDRVAHVKGVGSFRLSPPSDYLFGDRDGPAATWLHNFILRVQPRRHRQEMGRPLLSQPRLCASCHAQFIDREVNDWGWIQLQDDYAAWLRSPFSGTSDLAHRSDRTQRCQDCHFPLVEGSDPSADTSGRFRSHRTAAANTVIPSVNGDQGQVDAVVRFLSRDRIRVSIEPERRREATRGRLHLDREAIVAGEEPPYLDLGDETVVRVVVQNVGVGHDFPGGTIDINEAWIEVAVVDGQGHTVFASGTLSGTGEVDPYARFYRQLAVDREGRHIWRHDLFNMVGDSYRAVVPAGGADVVPYRFTVPAWAKGPLTVSARVRYRKFNPRYARWALNDPDANPPIVDMARAAIAIGLRPRPERERSVPDHTP